MITLALLISCLDGAPSDKDPDTDTIPPDTDTIPPDTDASAPPPTDDTGPDRADDCGLPVIVSWVDITCIGPTETDPTRTHWYIDGHHPEPDPELGRMYESVFPDWSLFDIDRLCIMRVPAVDGVQADATPNQPFIIEVASADGDCAHSYIPILRWFGVFRLSTRNDICEYAHTSDADGYPHCPVGP